MFRNLSTGRMPVEVAASKGERFRPDGTPIPDDREARATVTLGAGGSAPVSIRTEFEPARLVVAPDVRVPQLRRKAAVGAY